MEAEAAFEARPSAATEAEVWQLARSLPREPSEAAAPRKTSALVTAGLGDAVALVLSFLPGKEPVKLILINRAWSDDVRRSGPHAISLHCPSGRSRVDKLGHSFAQCCAWSQSAFRITGLTLPQGVTQSDFHALVAMSTGFLRDVSIYGGGSANPAGALKHCTSLETLRLVGCHRLTALQLTALAQCPSLIHLELNACFPAPDLVPLISLFHASLRSLKLCGCPSLADLSLLSEAASLRHLVIRYCSATLGPMPPALETLELVDTNITTTATLSLPASLTSLDLVTNVCLEDVSALAGCASLKVVTITDDNLALTAFIAPASLTKLDLSNNPNLLEVQLSLCTASLTELNLDRCKSLKDVEGLADCSSLTRRHLPFRGCMKLNGTVLEALRSLGLAPPSGSGCNDPEEEEEEAEEADDA